MNDGRCTCPGSGVPYSADECCSCIRGMGGASCFDNCHAQAGVCQTCIQYGGGNGCVNDGRCSCPHNTCLGGWPLFPSQSELNADAWGAYFRIVYGQDAQPAFPFCVGDLWTFFDNILLQTGASAPTVKGNCPAAGSPDGLRYVQNNAYQQGMSYSMRRPPYAAIATNTWVEVSHMADPFGDEHFGMWLLLASGNGVWFNTGITTTFSEHDGAFAQFGATSNEQMCQNAASQGYDSVQFTAHVDGVNYPCAAGAGLPYMNLEIVAVKLTGTYACGDPNGAPASIRGGWEGSLPCNCNNGVGRLNCGVWGSAAVESWQLANSTLRSDIALV